MTDAAVELVTLSTDNPASVDAPGRAPAGCGKWAYLSRKAARRHAHAQHPGQALKPYRCPHRSGWWHFGTRRGAR